MLAMGVHPAVASASSACMILFTSFTATTSFVVFGLLDREYALICFATGFVSTYFGQIGLSILMRRAQRNSYIAFFYWGSGITECPVDDYSVDAKLSGRRTSQVGRNMREGHLISRVLF